MLATAGFSPTKATTFKTLRALNDIQANGADTSEGVPQIFSQ
jgi:hypothetical protein